MHHQSSANETLALHCICIYMPKNIITDLFWQTRASDCSTLVPGQDITYIKVSTQAKVLQVKKSITDPLAPLRTFE